MTGSEYTVLLLLFPTHVTQNIFKYVTTVAYWLHETVMLLKPFALKILLTVLQKNTCLSCSR